MVFNQYLQIIIIISLPLVFSIISKDECKLKFKSDYNILNFKYFSDIECICYYPDMNASLVMSTNLLYKIAMNLIAKENYKVASECLLKYIDNNPLDSNAILDLAHVYIKDNRPLMTFPILNEVIKHHSNDFIVKTAKSLMLEIFYDIDDMELDEDTYDLLLNSDNILQFSNRMKAFELKVFQTDNNVEDAKQCSNDSIKEMFPRLSDNHGLYQDVAAKYHDFFKNNIPFPHISIDNLFDVNFIKRVSDEFPKHAIGDNLAFGWDGSQINVQNRKLWCRSEICMGDYTNHLISHLQSSVFVQFLERLTGIHDLIADTKHFGGGLHQIQSGGHLSIHADFARYYNGKLWRRVNVFVYLNDDWQESYGGHLELWDRNITKKVISFAPILNRLVIFETSDFSFHGHPDKLNTPLDVTRKSIALYYYTATKGDAELSNRMTNFQRRPGELNLIIDG